MKKITSTKYIQNSFECIDIFQINLPIRLQVETLLTQHITKEGPSLPMTPTDDVSMFNSLNPDLRIPPVSGRQIWEAVLGMALCHNVTPVYDKEQYNVAGSSSIDGGIKSCIFY